jgi:flagellar motor switch protein FliM
VNDVGEVLSQNEIDNLLAALSTGELDVDNMNDPGEVQVKNYDFERPAKFSKEHLRTLEIIFEHYGRLLSTNLPIYLRKNVQINVASSETVTFSEFTNALATPSILGIANFAPLNGNIILDLSTNLGFAMIDRMLGGPGVPMEKSREFSDIELTILEKTMVVCVQLLREPWKNVVEINPYLDRLETNPQFAQVIAPNDMIAIVTLNLKMGDVEGLMNVCLPYFTLESIMDRLNTKYWFANMKETDDARYDDYIESLIRRVEVPVKALLGKSSVSVNDFVNLQVGDVIRLDSRVDQELAVYVGNIKKFTAMPGTEEDRYAVQVTSVIREED